MAITFVGSYAATHKATSAQTIAFSNLKDESNVTPTLQQGDYVLVAVENAGNANRTQAQLTPSGYTALHTDDYQNDSNDSNFLVSGKFMGATPDTTVDIPASSATTHGVGYEIYVFRGINATTPMDVTVVVTGGINTGVADAAAITPVTAGAWIVVFAGAAVAAGAVFTNPAGMSTTTNHFRTATDAFASIDAVIGGAIYTGWTSGAYDPAAFGGSTSTNTGSWSAVTLALRPIVSHAATGTLTGQGSVVAGSAVHNVTHGSTGALTGQGSTVAGSAARSAGPVSHDASGALTSQGSALAGTSARFRAFDATGAVTGPGSVLAGSSARYRVFDASGVLAGSGSSLAGSAARSSPVVHDTTGGLVGPGSAVAGSAARFRAFSATGALSGSGALVGVAHRIAGPVAHDATGALTGQGARATGAARIVLFVPTTKRLAASLKAPRITMSNAKSRTSGGVKANRTTASRRR